MRLPAAQGVELLLGDGHHPSSGVGCRLAHRPAHLSGVTLVTVRGCTGAVPSGYRRPGPRRRCYTGGPVKTPSAHQPEGPREVI